MRRSLAGRKVFLTAALALSLSGCGYNTFQTTDEQVKAGWAEVINPYPRRADLIPNLVSTVKGEASFEQDTLTKVVDDQTFQTQCLRGHSITTHAGNVGVALAARQNAQHQRAQHVARTRRVGAAVAQRARIDPAVEHAGGGQKLGSNLPVRRGLCRLVPANVHSTAHRVHGVRIGSTAMLRFISPDCKRL